MTITSVQITNVVQQLQNKPELTKAEQELLQTLQNIESNKNLTLSDTQQILFNDYANNSTTNSFFMPTPQSNVDFDGAISTLTDVEALMILVASLSRTIREAKYQEGVRDIQAKIADLKASAAEKKAGAEKQAHAAIAALSVGLLAALGSMAGGVVSIRSFDGINGANALTGEALEKFLKRTDLVVGLTKSTTDLVASGSTFASAQGQADAQKANAIADEFQAEAASYEQQAKQQEDIEKTAKDLAQKMLELMQSLADAKQKAADAAARA